MISKVKPVGTACRGADRYSICFKKRKRSDRDAVPTETSF
jgi:hypothetical protein